MRVLVIEERPGEARPLLDLLREAPGGPFQVLTAGSPEEALAGLERTGADVVLLDMAARDRRDLATLRRLVERAPEVPVVVVTESVDQGMAIEILRAGAEDFLLKDPLDPDRISRTLRYAMERKRAERALAEANRRLREELEERQKAEAGLRRTVRALRTLAACTRAMPEASDETGLLQAFCQIAVNEGGYRMVWAGLKEDDRARTVRPVAVAGHHEGYLDVVRISWADTEHGRGPAGTAARTGRPSVVRHVDADPRFEIWRREALARGYRSIIALPLRTDGETIGVLVACSEEPDAFDAEEVRLLERVAETLSAGMVSRRLAAALQTSEERLRQSQRLEAVGQLAGGLAHDFNNLIQIILGQCEITLHRVGDNPAIRRSLEDILSAALRAADLTRQLLAFSRKQVLEPRVVNLNGVVRSVTRMLDRLIGEDVRIETRLARDLGHALVDPGQMEQVLVNLAVNARDAMPEGGTLTIETANVDLDETYSDTHGRLLEAGPYVMLAVSDSGTGMDAETRDRVFEPFFTTKAQGEGSGLGLATVYGIVKQSGGHIWVYSEPGRGTTFKVYLPRLPEGRVEEPGPAPSRATLGPHGTETVLLVEDDAGVRETVKETLLLNGYQVLEASGPGEALLLAEKYGRGIDLILTDVVMPHMNGRELVERLRRWVPDARVLYMSGYTGNAIVHHGVLASGVSLIQKPFTREALARKVREALNGV